MNKSRRIPCPECRKKFKRESGLRWHLYHRHGWENVQELIAEHNLAKLAKEAMLNEIELEVFAKGANVDVNYLKRLIEKLSFGSF